MGKYLGISSYSILRSPSSYMTLQLLHLKFLVYEENLIFFFINAPLTPHDYRVDPLTRINQLLRAHNSVTSDALTVLCTVQIMGVGMVAG